MHSKNEDDCAGTPWRRVGHHFFLRQRPARGHKEFIGPGPNHFRMSKYYRYFGLERDPFLDTADPYFYCELGRCVKPRTAWPPPSTNRGAYHHFGEPGTGKTSLRRRWNKIFCRRSALCWARSWTRPLPPKPSSSWRSAAFSDSPLPPRSSAALKNALKNFFFETAVLESRTLVLIIDEAQNLSDEELESLRLLLNYHVPQKKLLNILLFGQSELERRVNERTQFGRSHRFVDSPAAFGRRRRPAPFWTSGFRGPGLARDSRYSRPTPANY